VHRTVLCPVQGDHRCFFFSSRRRHTRFSRDWSSDVCSSDLYTRLEQRVGLTVRESAVDLAMLDAHGAFRRNAADCEGIEVRPVAWIVLRLAAVSGRGGRKLHHQRDRALAGLGWEAAAVVVVTGIAAACIEQRAEPIPGARRCRRNDPGTVEEGVAYEERCALAHVEIGSRTRVRMTRGVLYRRRAARGRLE